jgi:hypothetical protein
VSEEIYYAPGIEPSGPDRPYLVFCMLRAKTPGARPLASAVDVRWEVTMSLTGEGKPETFQGVRRIDQPGQVLYANGGYSYVGLVPLATFQRPDAPGRRPWVADARSMPPTLRGWSDGRVGDGAVPVIRAH